MQWEESRFTGIDADPGANENPFVQRHAYTHPKGETLASHESLLDQMTKGTFKTPWEKTYLKDPWRKSFNAPLYDLVQQGAFAIFDSPSGMIELHLPHGEIFVFEVYVLFAHGDLAAMVQAIYVLSSEVAWRGVG